VASTVGACSVCKKRREINKVRKAKKWGQLTQILLARPFDFAKYVHREFNLFDTLDKCYHYAQERKNDISFLRKKTATLPNGEQ
jgi:hypothetical protein